MQDTYHVFGGVVDVFADVIGEAIDVRINADGLLAARIAGCEFFNFDIAERRVCRANSNAANWVICEIGLPVFDNVVLRNVETSFSRCTR